MTDLAELQIVIKSGEAVIAKGRLDKLTAAGNKTDKSVKRLGHTSSRTAKSLQSMVTPLRTVGTLFAGLTLGVLISSLADFEQAMANVSAVSGATGKDLEKLTQQAKDLGSTTKFSASQAAAGMEFLARAGFETNEILSALPATLNLAAAGALDLGEAADIASNIMSGFNIEATEMGRVADVLALAAASANTTVGQLGQGMKFAAPVAAAFGQSLEDITALMSALGDAGIQASMAGTNLRQIMLALANPTSEAAATLERYGVGLEEVNPAMHSLVDVMMRLKEANITTGDSLKIFSARTAGAYLAIQSMLPKVNELSGSLLEADGAAKRMADTMSDNLKGDILEMKSAFEGLILSVGESGASGALRTSIQSMRDGLRALGENADQVIFTIEVLAVAFGVKMVAGLTASTAATIKQTVARVASAKLYKTEVAALLAASKVQTVKTAATLAEAKANQALLAQMAIYGPARAAANVAVVNATAAHTIATAATEAHAVALAHASLAARGLTVAMGLLSKAMRFLFLNPVGLVITSIAAAFLLFSRDADVASASADQLAAELRQLTANLKELN